MYSVMPKIDTSVDTLFLSSKPLYENRGLIIDFSVFPLVPEKLLYLLDNLSLLRINTLAVRWGGLFPWKFEERLQSPHAYPEQVLSGFYTRAKKNGIRVYTIIPGPENLHFVLRIKPFAYLRKYPQLTDILNPAAPGAFNLVNEMVDDICSICEPTDIFIESSGSAGKPGYTAAPRGGERDTADFGGYYHRLIIACEDTGKNVIVQVPFPGIEEAGISFTGNITSACNQEDLSESEQESRSPSPRVDWTICDLEKRDDRKTVLSENVFFSLPEIPGRYVFSSEVYSNIIPLVLEGASFLWNGRSMMSALSSDSYFTSMYPAINAAGKYVKEFEAALAVISDHADLLKDTYSFLITRGAEAESEDVCTRDLFLSSDDALKTAEYKMKTCIHETEPLISRRWMEEWCRAKLFAVSEDLKIIKLRLQLLFDAGTPPFMDNS